MAATFATLADVEDSWRSLAEEEKRPALRKIAQASAILRNKFATIDARIASGDLDPELVLGVVVSMVVRALRNPDGKRQESIEDYAFTRDAVTASGELVLTDAEIALLSPQGTGRRTGAFAIRTTPPRWCW